MTALTIAALTCLPILAALYGAAWLRREDRPEERRIAGERPDAARFRRVVAALKAQGMTTEDLAPILFTETLAQLEARVR